MEPFAIYLVAAIPWVIEALWAFLWLPGFIRMARERQELQARLGPDIPLMLPSEGMFSFLGCALYHLPATLIVLLMPRRLLGRWRMFRLALTMIITPVLYSGVVFWIVGLRLHPDS